MKRILLFLPLFLVLNLISCSSEENIKPEEPEETVDPNDDLNPVDPDNDGDASRINVVGKWLLNYTIETNHDGTHVGTEKKIKATEYNFVEYVFKEDNTFVETIAEGESLEEVEISTKTGTYKAENPRNRSGNYLELRYEDGDWSDRSFELNSDSTMMKIDLGTTTDVNCGCSDNKWDYEQFYDLVE